MSFVSHLHALILAHDTCQLQITLDLLPDLLETVNNGHCGDGMDTTQNVQSHIHQTLGEKSAIGYNYFSLKDGC